jgi:hypothetical protein
MAAHFTAERWRAYHEREKAYYRNPMIQWFSAGVFINAKKFYIWDGRIVGEATLVDSGNSN